MQSTTISITCQSQSMAPKLSAPKGPKLIHGYTPLIGPEAWMSTMGKGGCSPHPHPSFTRCRIRTSTFYHRPKMADLWSHKIGKIKADLWISQQG